MARHSLSGWRQQGVGDGQSLREVTVSVNRLEAGYVDEIR